MIIGCLLCFHVLNKALANTLHHCILTLFSRSGFIYSIISIILPDPEDDDDDEEERIVWRDLVTGLTGDSCQCLVCQV